MLFRRSAVLLALFTALAFATVAAKGQGIITGSVTGTVEDPTGASIPNATITATNVATGIAVTGKSGGRGEFVLSNVPVGTYKVEIAISGFGTTTLNNVTVEAGKDDGLGVQKLTVGTTAESVDVTAASSLLETVQAQVTTTFDAVQVANLPTGGGFDELALLIPGVVSTHSNNFSNTNGAGISSNGQRGRSNNFEIDGQSNNDNSVAGPQVFFSNQDALQEVQIITNNFSAQYGRDAGSVVNYITKSGTNAIHGTAFYFYEGSWLSSLTQGQKGPQFGYCTPGEPVINPTTGTAQCTAVHKPRFDDNEYGGTLGGPIIKDKLFGFGSALFARNFSGQTILNSGTLTSTTGYTPTPAGISALQAAYPTNPGVQSLAAFGPYAANYGTGGVTQIPGSTYNAPVTDGTTTITIPVSLYSRTISPYSTDEEVLGRIDWQATGRDRFYARYFYQTNPSFPYNSTVTGGIVNVTDKVHSIGADWTHTFTPRIVNQLRYSFQQSTLAFQGGAFPNCTITSLSNCPASLGVSTAYGVSATNASTGAAKTITPIASFGLSTSYPQGRIVKDTQVQNNLTITAGKHSMTMGGAYEFQNSPNVFLPNISGGFTYFGANGLLQDGGQVGLAYGNAAIHFTEPDVAAYFQDDWKVTPELTLNLGMRWEFFSQSINLLHNISLANETSATPLWSTALPLSQTVFPYEPQDYKHFEPRLGFAYNPAGMKSVVIRGGFAVNIAPAFYNIFLNSYGSAPVVLSSTITGCNNTTKLCTPTGGATYTSVHAQDNQYLLPAGGAPSTLNPGNYNQTLVGNNFREPVTETYTLGVQKQIGRFIVAEARYVGVHTFADFQTVNGNPAIGLAASKFPTVFNGTGYCTTAGTPGLNTTPYTITGAPAVANGQPIALFNTTANNGRTSCANSNVRTRQNSAFEVYNGLQTSIDTRSFHGITANFSYTWSRTIDNASEIFSTDGGGTTNAVSQNPLDPNFGERGVSGNSYPNVTSLGLVYVLPWFHNQHNFKAKLLGGFQLNTIYLFNSGQPYTPYQADGTISCGATTCNVPKEANFSDYNFNSAFIGIDSARPILANKNAPINAVGYNAGNGTYVDQATGNVVARSSEHWLFNNYAEAAALGNPYPGVGRNTLRGGTYNNVNASIFKNNQITERINLQLQVTAFNALNRAYYGSPDAAIEDSASTFANYTGNGGSNRNVQVGARVIF